MSDWKDQDSEFLYIEEVNTNEGHSQRLTGITTSHPVIDLKKAIATTLNSPASWSNITLAYADKELTDLYAPLSTFAIEEGDTIFFTRSVSAPAINPPAYTAAKEVILGTIFFKHVDDAGKTFSVKQVPIESTVRALIERLGREKSLETEYYRFLWGGKQLKMDMTLMEYGLGNESTIHIVMRVRGGWSRK